MAKKKKKEELKPEEPELEVDIEGDRAGFSRQAEVEDIVEEPKPEELEPVKKKRVDYQKTVKFGKDRFGNPRSQRDFETSLRHIIPADERLTAWQAFNTGGTVTLVLKK